MSEAISNLTNQLDSDPNFIVGKYIDTKDAIELFIKNPKISTKEVMENIKKITGLKVTGRELFKHTLIISEWGPYDCHVCGNQMNSVDKNGVLEYFCNQCVKFK
jgi:hypothetical protein